jgi:peptidoglycan/LPS O-acetylase OafA/YrhL
VGGIVRTVTPIPHDRFVAGDPLRAVAALGVLVVHAAAFAAVQAGYGPQIASDPVAGYAAAYGSVVGSLISGGWMGFLVFFVLSGYLVGGPYARAAVERRPGQPMSAYVRNRLLRIVPAYWVVLTAIVVVFVGLTGEAKPTFGDIAAAYLFHVSFDNALLGWIGQAWTLEIEIKFYAVTAVAAVALFPLVGRLRDARSRALAIAVPCAACLVTMPLVYGPVVTERRFHVFLGLLLAGVALGALEPLVRPRVARSAVWARAGAAAALAGAAYCLGAGLGSTVSGFFVSGVGTLVGQVAIVAVVAGPLVAQWATGGCWRVLDNGPLRWLGARSYSFYLVHFAVLWWLAKTFGESGFGYKETFVLLLPAGIAMSAVLAACVYRFVERPFLARKRSRATVHRAVGGAAPIGQPTTP